MYQSRKINMNAAETFIVIHRKIGVEGQRRQTATYIYHQLHKKR